MKYVLLAIFVLIAAQPLPASSCDMSDGQGANNSMHSNMHDGPMDDHGQDMECCDQDDANHDDACKSMSHCGACPAGMVAVTPSSLDTAFGSNPPRLSAIADGILSRSGSPPFRPPIA